MPLPPELGTGLGKPLKFLGHPVRGSIPIFIAAIGEKNVELAAEIADRWGPIFFVPEKADATGGASLARGRAKRDASLAPLEIVAGGPVAIGEDVEHLRDLGRPHLALYVGGMGARGMNFYNELVSRYGWEAEAKCIQDLYLEGRRQEAMAAMPLRSSKPPRSSARPLTSRSGSPPTARRA